MLRLLIASPFLLIIVLFALSNRQPVTLAFWPTDFQLTVPLALAMLTAMAVAFLLGALFAWISGLGARLRARRLAREAERLKAELQARQPAPPAAGTAVVAH
jgi:uncharacterized integral membrane protein